MASQKGGEPVNMYGTFPYPTAPPQERIPPPVLSPPVLHQYVHPQPPPDYQAIPVGYQCYAGPTVVVQGVPVRVVREPRLPCCGMGIGWALFVAGFFFAAVPWYVGAFILLFVRADYREKAGLVACMVAAVLAAIATILGASTGAALW